MITLIKKVKVKRFGRIEYKTKRKEAQQIEKERPSLVPEQVKAFLTSMIDFPPQITLHSKTKRGRKGFTVDQNGRR